MVNKESNQWCNQLEEVLLKDNQFALENEFVNGQTFVQKYRYQKNKKTYIEIGYLYNSLLIYFHFFNDDTLALNASQTHYFESNEFDISISDRSPGIDYTDLNIEAIIKLLFEGLNGTEKIYYKNGLPYYSVVKILNNNSTEYSTYTYHHQKWNLLDKAKAIFGKNYDDLEYIEINLQDVFAGIKG